MSNAFAMASLPPKSQRTYNTTEQWTGEYWENPTTKKQSKIYCKQLTCNNVPGNGSTSYPHGVLDIDAQNYFDARGFVRAKDGTIYGFPRADVIGNTSVCIDRLTNTEIFILSRWENTVIDAVSYTHLRAHET